MTAPVPAPGSHLERLRSKIEQRNDPTARLTLLVDDTVAVRLRKADYTDDLQTQRQTAAAGDDGDKRLSVLASYVARYTEAVLAVVDLDAETTAPMYEDGTHAVLDERLAEHLTRPWISAPDLLRAIVGEAAVDDLAEALSQWSFPQGTVKTLKGESAATRR